MTSLQCVCVCVCTLMTAVSDNPPCLVSSLWLGLESQFDKVSTRLATTQGVTYDYESIMHYSSTAFSRNGRPTILPLTSSVSPSQLGNRRGFTSRDLQHVNTLYRCQGTGEGEAHEDGGSVFCMLLKRGWGSRRSCRYTSSGCIRGTMN